MSPSENRRDPRFRSNRDVAIHVVDLARARSFYAETLGFTLVSEADDQLIFDTGNFTLYVNRDTEVMPFIPALEVEDYPSAKQHLISHGCKILREWPEYKALYFEDPFGIVMDIIEKKRG